MTVACVESQNLSPAPFSLSGVIIPEAGEALQVFSVQLSECSLMNSEVFLKSFMSAYEARENLSGDCLYNQS